jgi:hypothetical protein
MTPVRPSRALLILFALLLLLGSWQGSARCDDEETDQNQVGLQEGVDYPVPGPDQFLSTGQVDFIDMESGSMTIDDTNYLLLPTTEFYTSVMGAGSIHLFREGVAAGFIADRNGWIHSIWLLE